MEFQLVAYRPQPRFASTPAAARNFIEYDPYLLLCIAPESADALLALADGKGTEEGAKALAARESMLTTAYRELAAVFHPDVAGEAAEARLCKWVSVPAHFCAIVAAYDLLRDPLKTIEYLIACEFVGKKGAAAAADGVDDDELAFGSRAGTERYERLTSALRREHAVHERAQLLEHALESYAEQYKRHCNEGDGFFVTLALYGPTKEMNAVLKRISGGKALPGCGIAAADVRHLSASAAVRNARATEEGVLDVTAMLQCRVQTFHRRKTRIVQLSLPSEPKHTLPGIWDPTPAASAASSKKLFVRYEYAGAVHEAIVKDEQELLCPVEAHVVEDADESAIVFDAALPEDEDDAHYTAGGHMWSPARRRQSSAFGAAASPSKPAVRVTIVTAASAPAVVIDTATSTTVSATVPTKAPAFSTAPIPGDENARPTSVADKAQPKSFLVSASAVAAAAPGCDGSTAIGLVDSRRSSRSSFGGLAARGDNTSVTVAALALSPSLAANVSTRRSPAKHGASPARKHQQRVSFGALDSADTLDAASPVKPVSRAAAVSPVGDPRPISRAAADAAALDMDDDTLAPLISEASPDTTPKTNRKTSTNGRASISADDQLAALANKLRKVSSDIMDIEKLEGETGAWRARLARVKSMQKQEAAAAGSPYGGAAAHADDPAACMDSTCVSAAEEEDDDDALSTWSREDDDGRPEDVSRFTKVLVSGSDGTQTTHNIVIAEVFKSDDLPSSSSSPSTGVARGAKRTHRKPASRSHAAGASGAASDTLQAKLKAAAQIAAEDATAPASGTSWATMAGVAAVGVLAVGVAAAVLVRSKRAVVA